MIHTQRIGPGAKVVIRRSGDVIPKLDKVLAAASQPSFPADKTWVWDGEESTAAHIKAVGSSKESLAAKLHYFLKTLDIPGAGPATATALVDANIYGPAALWALSPAELSKILGPKTGANLHTHLRDKMLSVSELTLMHASSTMPRGVGDTKLGSLFGAVADPRKWSEAMTPPTGWTTESLKGFIAEFPTYIAWRSKEIHWIPYPIMSSHAAAVTAAAAAKTAAKGETICMTGFRDKSLEDSAIQRGHAFSPTFTGKVTILLVPDGPVKESEKVKAARAKDVKIIPRTEFVAQYLS
jgi:NAD-dependent DNA ligase